MQVKKVPSNHCKLITNETLTIHFAVTFKAKFRCSTASCYQKFISVFQNKFCYTNLNHFLVIIQLITA